MRIGAVYVTLIFHIGSIQGKISAWFFFYFHHFFSTLVVVVVRGVYSDRIQKYQRNHFFATKNEKFLPIKSNISVDFHHFNIYLSEMSSFIWGIKSYRFGWDFHVV